MVANIPEKLFNSSGEKVKNLSPEELKKLNAWARNSSGQLFLAGKPGRGKTSCAIALMRFFESKNIPLSDQFYWFLPELFELWKSQMNEGWVNFDMMNKLKAYKVLILDDIGTRDPSPSFLDFLYVIINHRCLTDCITIYTSNLSSKELNDSFGPRIVSRMTEGLILKFEGEDLRQSGF
jgi:DNA replication protein DnaC